jgi:hypothetical protein
MAAFTLEWQIGVTVTGTIGPRKPKIFTILDLWRKVCRPACRALTLFKELAFVYVITFH